MEMNGDPENCWPRKTLAPCHRQPKARKYGDKQPVGIDNKKEIKMYRKFFKKRYLKHYREPRINSVINAKILAFLHNFCKLNRLVGVIIQTR